MLNAIERREREIKLRRVLKAKQLYVMLILPLVFTIVFAYVPMYGVQIAFKDYSARLGIWRSPWVGFFQFERFFRSYTFSRVIINTLVLSFYSIVVGFPIPIILALALNSLSNVGFKKTVQMVTYAPHFISTVVMAGMIVQLLSPRFGLVNRLLDVVGIESINFMGAPEYFRHIYVWSGVWQDMGYSSIIYIAALSAIDPELHEAAIMDGGTKVQRTFYIDIPGITPTIMVLLIMRMGSIIRVGFEKTFLLQTALNLRTSEVIATYVYKVGIAAGMPNFSFAAAIGLFESIIGLLLLVSVNAIAKRLGETSLW